MKIFAIVVVMSAAIPAWLTIRLAWGEKAAETFKKKTQKFVKDVWR